MDITSNIKSLLKEAEQLRGILEKRFVQVEADISKIKNAEIKEYLKNCLTLAKENKLNVQDFLQNIKTKCQQK